MRYPAPTGRTSPAREGNGFVLYADGERFRLNGVGARILSLCDGTRTLDEVATAIAAHYEIPESRALDETSAFCAELEGGSMLAFADAPSDRRWSAWHERTAPWSVTIEITQRCNMRCVHCYNASGDDEPGSLRLEEIIRVLSELRALGTASVNFAGGEPLMRVDLDEMLAATARLGMSVGIASNGFALTPARAEQLAKQGLGTVQISLDFPDERHDEFRRRTSAFIRAEAAVRNAAAAGMHTIVSTTVTQDNMADAERIKDRARDLGAAYHLVNRFIPTRRGATLAADIANDDFHAVVERLRGSAPPMIGCDPVVSGATHCAVGSGHLTIAHNGDIKPCVSFQASAGNIRQTPVRDIWRNSPLLVALRERQFSSLFDGNSPGCPSYDFATAVEGSGFDSFARVFP